MGQRDFGHQVDDRFPFCYHRLGTAQEHLALAASGHSVEVVHRFLAPQDLLDRGILLVAEVVDALKAQVFLDLESGDAELPSSSGDHHAQRFPERAQIVPAHPIGKVDELPAVERRCVDDALDRLHIVCSGESVQQLDDKAGHLPLAEWDDHPMPYSHLVGDLGIDGIGKGLLERQVQGHHGKQGHHDLPDSWISKYAATFFKSSQTGRFSSKLRNTAAGW